MNLNLDPFFEKIKTLQNEFNAGTTESTKLIFINSIINEMNELSNTLIKAKSLLKDENMISNLIEQSEQNTKNE